MQHRKKGITVLLLVCTLALAGCGSSHTGEGTGGNAPSQPSQNADTDPSEKGSGDELLDHAALKGTVSDFQEGSFQVMADRTEDNGQTAVGAAPGMESESRMESTTVSYGGDCVFQIANIDSSTGAVDLEDAVSSDVKKSTSVAVYGETQENGEIHATKVLITRF